MKPTDPLVELQGSERKIPAEAVYVGPVEPGERIEVSVYLRPRKSLATNLMPSGAPRRMTRKSYAEEYGARSEHVAGVESFAKAHGLLVVESDPTKRRVVLAGSASAVAEAFGVELGRYKLAGQAFRGRRGAIKIPAGLADVIQSVHGLDDRRQANPHVRFRPHTDPGTAVYTPPQVAGLYDFPEDGDGTGQCIGLIELGGGFVQADLDAYFSQLELPSPRVTAFSVDGGGNSPGDSDDVEVMLDIEVAGGVAPGANIVVYFAPNSDRGFIDAITDAVFDTVNHLSVISISWGGAESSWTTQSLQAMNQAIQAGGALGITICVASGDDGSRDLTSDGLAHVDFPASSPFSLGCGGTTLLSANGEISSETAWSQNGATGGGISDAFDLPSWQQQANIPPSANPGGRVGRGVPDVAAVADPDTGYLIRVDGVEGVVGGTSAAAPLWAGLIALINEQLVDPVGFINPNLYQNLIVQADVTRDIVEGNNGAYFAGLGWDACTGLGSPDGEDCMAALIY
ncbi:MAG TPA: S53 family peptidase [Candidatus Solibacter sp.]|nr:S53 family peptidase [Candidatus Solibacter sp.]